MNISRAVHGRVMALAGAAVAAAFVVGCIPPAPPIIPPTPEPPVTTPSACTLHVQPGVVGGNGTASAPFGTIAPAIASAKPGSVICVGAGDLGAERPLITVSGREGAPIELRATGAAVLGGFDVKADWWIISGFDVQPRSSAPTPGIAIRGTGVQVIRNTVRNATDYGIRCDTSAPSCDRGLIANNRVLGSVGTGIFVYGADVLVQSNDVSGSVQVGSSDADGIRFFGDRLTIRRNHVHDISAAGWPAGTEPHADCFQTFTESKRPVVDVVLDGNTCDRVADQCLIAEGNGTSQRLTFINNICRNSGSQALYIRNVQNVTIANNLFLPSIAFTGVFLADGASGVSITNNVFVGDFDPYTVTAAPVPWADYNLAATQTGGVPPVFSEPHGMAGRLPGYLGQLADLRTTVSIAPGDPTVDTGAATARATDRFGRARPVDGNGDGLASWDVGPFER